MNSPLLSVDNLSVSFGDNTVVHDLSFSVNPGECVAIVGESGSGKSVTARSLLGLAGARSRVSASTLSLNGRDLSTASDRDWRRIRGSQVGLVLQDALVSLDPLRPIGREIGDALRLHGGLSALAAQTRVLEVLSQVGMPYPERAVSQRSGDLSGGLRQRALIAAALALHPPLLIADEPTTALDVTIQARILDLLAEIKANGTGILLISHDLAVVSAVADRVLVMKDGRIVESGDTRTLLNHPREEYTQRLIAAVPTDKPRGTQLVPGAPAVRTPPTLRTTDAITPVLEARSLVKTFPAPGGRFRAVNGVSFDLARGETLGLVGESGSGKTTVARLVLALSTPDEGSVLLDDRPFSELRERDRRPLRRRIGAIYQDSLSSFDPRMSVRRILTDALDTAPADDRSSVAELLDSVGLAQSVASTRPLLLSGGQRQRVSIARALAARPELIVCDEPVSALDVTVQAQVLDLLDRLQAERGLSYLFISHDLGVVRHMSDRIAVMKDGRIVETGNATDVFDNPQHPYTARLVADAPRLASHSA
ncbi:dipeptide ABC transporter ATP-binding protein [Mycetocola zhadangensis]|uniref:ABC transporter ATP-binding protein n=1 Tax=Mycetocola zhadangensis TaxID=1164595 RepID=A0A3L7J5W7_9MICO|nr:ABC transporter ATP-binding protein [Mycetocola zhadangensis]RLQ85934.1 ABC transporter ATP-binding protein [Mycetocola zhadangensis]GGE87061.1 ABC transporter ATP-binding protein [Mycetocola zhadangensis]